MILKPTVFNMSLRHLIQFDEEDKLAILKQYGRNRENVKQDVASIRTWLQKQPHIPESPSDNVLLTLLVTTKFNFDMAKKKLDMWYSARKFFPEFYLDPFCEQVQNVRDSIIQVPLPKLYQGEVRYFFSTFPPSKSDKYNYEAHVFSTINCMWLLQKSEEFSIKGFFFDCSNLSFGYLKKVNPITLRKAAKLYQLILPDRLYETHFYNVPQSAQTLLNLINTLYPFKTHQKFRIHENLQSVQNYFPTEILPKDYGGDELSLKELNDLWKTEINNRKTEIIQQFSLVVNENLRLEKLKESDIFGAEGNFRKLDID